ncbi:MAG: hypothetical protein B7X59_03050 [Polaromonas sp. 39-63-203]|jgi:hypothetical protein|uniref:hypothetical protein n=1 Tax=Polaromonas sp. TaxID=1869339 RepID=UPI000BD02ED4|nr:hypothetical protein [Polaromonas sp.]OYY52032.1 MAG: hypothetical protein B7Y54_08395 [Polaromonas sp. 35-63-240]OYZ00378.1 MAG: hypothetical protein B7Y42_04800 [Polaromonas sp. 28-63-22]OYZ84654.1 MAG: hypothetical protein B7Y03_02620 [Polaromonas sp. 24-62-144]OZB00145.1 MAG: hypothetical protein B7X59_03050 [Polaromonas sp. 39-63-203]HQS32467.1 hypothetical protein [Polaromonas sp.]
MSTLTTAELTLAQIAPSVTADPLQDRLAEAACYAVLRRVAPVLRHDIAGLMQPVGMLMMVLQRRVQMPEPDLPAIVKNVASVSTLTKEATTGCMNAMGWMASRDDTGVNLRSSLDEAIKLLAMELSASGLEMINGISDDAPAVPQSFYRNVLVGALLAFCDQRTAGGTLHASLEAGAGNSHDTARLTLRMRHDNATLVAETPAPDRKSRGIDWADVEAMARSFGASMSRGEGWLSLDLPQAG